LPAVLRQGLFSLDSGCQGDGLAQDVRAGSAMTSHLTPDIRIAATTAIRGTGVDPAPNFRGRLPTRCVKFGDERLDPNGPGSRRVTKKKTHGQRSAGILFYQIDDQGVGPHGWTSAAARRSGGTAHTGVFLMFGKRSSAAPRFFHSAHYTDPRIGVPRGRAALDPMGKKTGPNRAAGNVPLLGRRRAWRLSDTFFNWECNPWAVKRWCDGVQPAGSDWSVVAPRLIEHHDLSTFPGRCLPTPR